ncbi:hypothetical protein Dimus_034107 [Dionaea muscipula]
MADRRTLARAAVVVGQKDLVVVVGQKDHGVVGEASKPFDERIHRVFLKAVEDDVDRVGLRADREDRVGRGDDGQVVEEEHDEDPEQVDLVSPADLLLFLLVVEDEDEDDDDEVLLEAVVPRREPSQIIFFFFLSSSFALFLYILN